MGLETVVDDIKEEARARADEILEEAEQDADAQLAEAREEAEKTRQEAREEAEKEAEELREQELSSAKLESRKMESRERRELLSELRADAAEELAELEDGRSELTEKLLDAGIEELDVEEGVVYSAEGDEDLVRDLLEDRSGFEFGGTTEALGGVIVEASDGDVRVNNSFDSVLETVLNDSLKEVSEHLFGDGEEQE